LEHNFPLGSPSLKKGMGPLEVRRVDLSEVLSERGFHPAFIQKRRDRRQKLMLLCHVRRLEDRACKHEFPMQGDTLSLELACIYQVRVVDERKPTLRSDQLDDLVEVLVGLRR